MMKKSMKIGIMGGTFNPIHTGHLLLAQYAMDACKLDKVLFIPTGNSYMKDSREILSGDVRLKMVNLAIAGVEEFEGSDVEILREGNTYTCETLPELKKLYPGASFYFLMGADSFLSIHRWKSPEIILANTALVVVTRDGVSYERLEEQKKFLEKEYGGEVELVSFPTIDISSSEIRKRIREGKSVRFQVPEEVRIFIEENGLYEGN
ncbi:MAG: nicotinate-nucleotide adenylyltransferase [Lachnospiraceae bacterium]|nr:nicotinate-nucleotide adenylyltransferase [Lachnospiraceae bacterium]